MSVLLSTCLRYYSSLSVCHAVLSILSKGVYKLPSVSESPLEVCIATRRVVTLVDGSVTIEFGGVRALSPLKLGGEVDTMSPNQHA